MLLILHLQKRKYHSRDLAKEELASLYYDLKPDFPRFGPMQDTKGIMWMLIDDDFLEIIKNRAHRLGYTEGISSLIENPVGKIRFRNQRFDLQKIYNETDSRQKNSPDKRQFLLATETGLKSVKGYRGTGEETGPKALSVIEAKMLVNLTLQNNNARFLDPFAGIGGIVLEALAAGFETFSCDISKVVAEGLKKFGSKHFIANAENLPFDDHFFDAIATELPFAKSTHDSIPQWLSEMSRVTKEKGKIVIMCTPKQANIIRSHTAKELLDIDLNTKRGSLDVVVLRVVNGL